MRSVTRVSLVCFVLGTSPPVAGQTHPGVVAPPTAGAFAAAAVFYDGELFVGRPGELGLFPLPANRSGAVHVYGDSDDGWKETATVEPSRNELGIGFGDALDVHNGVLVVGAPRDGDAGAAYVFERDESGVWVEVARLEPDSGMAGEAFGSSVTVLNGLALVGSPTHGDAGRVTAFQRSDAAVWRWVADLTPPESESNARFGNAVDLADGMAIVSAPGEMVSLLPVGAPPNLLPGSVYVYRIEDEGVSWIRESRLESGQPGPGGLGWAAMISAGEIFAAAPFSNEFGGGAFRFVRDEASDEWTLAETIAARTAPPQSLIGISMALAGEDLMLGAPLLGGGPGGAVVFRPGEDGAYEEVQVIQGSNAFAFFGFSVAGRQGVALLGAPGEAFFEGTGHVLTLDDGTGEWRESVALIDEVGGMEAVVGGQVDCENGEAASFTCSEVDLVAFMPVADLGGGRGVIVSDLWGWTDPETGREYAVVGQNTGTAFVDVTDAHNPVYLGHLPLPEGANLNMWRDVKVYADHAFVVADNAACRCSICANSGTTRAHR